MVMPGKKVNSILLIDDDPDDFELVSEAMQVVNPDISVYFVSRCGEEEKYNDIEFDLVLLDINMPYHDGFVWLKELRGKGNPDLPIVMYTNSLSPTHISKAYQEGANLYFSKPETFPKLMKGLQKLVTMDWSSPESVTEKYKQQGNYKTFQVE